MTDAGAPPHALQTSRATAALDAGRPEAAVRFAREALAETPDDVAALTALARGLWSSGDHAGGADAARRALALGSQHELLHRLVSKSASMAGDHRGALHGAHRALELAPDEPYAHLHLADVLIESGATANEPYRAQAWYAVRRALDLAPDHPGVLNSAARHFHSLGDIRSARWALNAGLAIAPDDADLQAQAAAGSKKLNAQVKGMVGVLGAAPEHEGASRTLEIISWEVCAALGRTAGYAALMAVFLAWARVAVGEFRVQLIFWPLLLLAIGWFRNGATVRKELPSGYLRSFVLRDLRTRVGMGLVTGVSVAFPVLVVLSFTTRDAWLVAVATAMSVASAAGAWIVDTERNRVLTAYGVLGAHGRDATDTRDDARGAVIYTVLSAVALVVVAVLAANGVGTPAVLAVVAIAFAAFAVPYVTRAVWAYGLIGPRVLKLWGRVS